MPVTDLLERNHKLYSDEVALVELNPLEKDTRKSTWKEYDLVQQTSAIPYRREITWSIFDEKANRVANMLLSRGIQKGDRVAILMFNCLEWLPIYFGILKTGAIAVPFNFRFSADEIQYCADLAEVHVLFFGPEFIGRVPVTVSLDSLDRDALVRILTEPKNSLVRQYQKLFELDGVTLHFDQDAIEAIADRAMERQTGARGLRAIMEDVMMDLMYTVPSDDFITEYTIHRDMVEGIEDGLLLESKSA